jgi:hypothetical protein
MLYYFGLYQRIDESRKKDYEIFNKIKDSSISYDMIIGLDNYKDISFFSLAEKYTEIARRILFEKNLLEPYRSYLVAVMEAYGKLEAGAVKCVYNYNYYSYHKDFKNRAIYNREHKLWDSDINSTGVCINQNSKLVLNQKKSNPIPYKKEKLTLLLTCNINISEPKDYDFLKKSINSSVVHNLRNTPFVKHDQISDITFILGDIIITNNESMDESMDELIDEPMDEPVNKSLDKIIKGFSESIKSLIKIILESLKKSGFSETEAEIIISKILNH